MAGNAGSGFLRSWLRTEGGVMMGASENSVRACLLDDPKTWPPAARIHMGNAIRRGVKELHAASVASMLNRGLLQKKSNGDFELHPSAERAYRKWAGLSR